MNQTNLPFPVSNMAYDTIVFTLSVLILIVVSIKYVKLKLLDNDNDVSNRVKAIIYLMVMIMTTTIASCYCYNRFFANEHTSCNTNPQEQATDSLHPDKTQQAEDTAEKQKPDSMHLNARRIENRVETKISRQLQSLDEGRRQNTSDTPTSSHNENDLSPKPIQEFRSFQKSEQAEKH